MKKGCLIRKSLREIEKAHDYYISLVRTSGKETADRWLRKRSGK